MKKADFDGFGFDFVATDRGLEITVVKPDSVAERIGLEVGDVIVSVYGYPATSAEKWEWLTSGDNGYVRLGIVDARTQKLVVRYVSMDK